MGQPADKDENQIAADLVGRIRDGDQRAIADVFQRYSRGLRFLLRRRTHDPQLVEDYLQETWAVALTKIRTEGLEDPGRLAGYLCGIASNLARSDARRVNRQRTTVDSDIVELIPDESSNPLRQLSRAELAAQVRALLAELSQPRDREILHSFYVAEEDKDSICARLGVDATHFNRVLHRARQRLKDAALRQATRDRLQVVS
jgi:RNA polymerase sigma-70 factor (ECF subfamily)